MQLIVSAFMIQIFNPNIYLDIKDVTNTRKRLSNLKIKTDELTFFFSS